MIEQVRRYRFFLILLLINLAILYLHPEIGWQSLRITGDTLLEMLAVLPPIFLLLGLLDVWVDREAMMKLMGENSGWLGISLAFLLGSAAAGPLYAAFPIAGVLIRKGAKLANVLIFIGAWSTTKIPMLLFEASAMGWKFMVVRFAVDIPGIALIAYATEKVLSQRERQDICEQAKSELQ